MKRRQLLHFAGGSLVASVAGCTGGDGNDIQDSDDDGVIDSKDYAPNDPDVQEKSDLVSSTTTTTTETSTTTTSSITTTTTSTTTTTTTTASIEGRISANYEPIADYTAAYFEWYSPTSATFTFNPSEYDNLRDKMDPVIVATEYPRGDVFAYHRTDSIIVGSSGETTVTIEYELDLPENQPFTLQLLLAPPNTPLEDAASEDVAYLTETDRLTVSEREFRKAPHPDTKDTVRTATYERIAGEGTYAISISGQVDFSLIIYKSAYVDRSEQPYDELMTTIQNSIQDGIALELSSIMYDAAEEAGYTSAREKVNYAVRAVQDLPYVSDDIGDPYDTYNKYPVETLVEGGGDCEDTTILLGATLSIEPYYYGCVVLYLPPEDSTHVALGVKGSDDVVGTYYTYEGDRYYYVETTGEGWEIGEIPRQYEDMQARIVPIIV